MPCQTKDKSNGVRNVKIRAENGRKSKFSVSLLFKYAWKLIIHKIKLLYQLYFHAMQNILKKKKKSVEYLE